MKDSDFHQLLASVKEAGRIKRGEQEPARKFEVRAEDVKAIRQEGHAKIPQAPARPTRG